MIARTVSFDLGTHSTNSVYIEQLVQRIDEILKKALFQALTEGRFDESAKKTQ